uniref:Uncharacterized protein n=1 Tax=Parascaris equorum TaxID=6256 RepID=A0A914RLA0_PAREQ
MDSTIWREGVVDGWALFFIKIQNLVSLPSLDGLCSLCISV